MRFVSNSLIELSFQYCREDNELLRKTGIRRRESSTKWKSGSGCHFNCISPGSGIRLVMSKGTLSKSSIQLCQADEYVSIHTFYSRILESRKLALDLLFQNTV